MDTSAQEKDPKTQLSYMQVFRTKMASAILYPRLYTDAKLSETPDNNFSVKTPDLPDLKNELSIKTTSTSPLYIAIYMDNKSTQTRTLLEHWTLMFNPNASQAPTLGQATQRKYFGLLCREMLICIRTLPLNHISKRLRSRTIGGLKHMSPITLSKTVSTEPLLDGIPKNMKQVSFGEISVLGGYQTVTLHYLPDAHVLESTANVKNFIVDDYFANFTQQPAPSFIPMNQPKPSHVYFENSPMRTSYTSGGGSPPYGSPFDSPSVMRSGQSSSYMSPTSPTSSVPIPARDLFVKGSSPDSARSPLDNIRSPTEIFSLLEKNKHQPHRTRTRSIPTPFKNGSSPQSSERPVNVSNQSSLPKSPATSNIQTASSVSSTSSTSEEDFSFGNLHSVAADTEDLLFQLDKGVFKLASNDRSLASWLESFKVLSGTK